MSKGPSFFERLTGGGDTPTENPLPISSDADTETSVETSPAPAPETAPSNPAPTQEEWMEEAQEGQLTIDVYQTDTDIVIKSTVAGVSPETLDIAITNDMVTVRGKRDRDEQVPQDQYFYQECYWGPFSRSVILPADVAADQAEATMKNGILTIRLPKVEKEQTKKIKVKTLA
jgi:HSP20 family protein